MEGYELYGKEQRFDGAKYLGEDESAWGQLSAFLAAQMAPAKGEEEVVAAEEEEPEVETGAAPEE